MISKVFNQFSLNFAGIYILVRNTIFNEKNAIFVALPWKRWPSWILNGMYCAHVFSKTVKGMNTELAFYLYYMYTKYVKGICPYICSFMRNGTQNYEKPIFWKIYAKSTRFHGYHIFFLQKSL